jgi:hypothetical protein
VLKAAQHEINSLADTVLGAGADSSALTILVFVEARKSLRSVYSMTWSVSRSIFIPVRFVVIEVLLHSQPIVYRTETDGFQLVLANDPGT